MNTGIAIYFFRIVKLYWESTAVEVNDYLLVRKDGISIGPSVTPFLSEMYLTALDLVLMEFILSCPWGDLVVTRFVDDILICAKQEAMINPV